MSNNDFYYENKLPCYRRWESLLENVSYKIECFEKEMEHDVRSLALQTEGFIPEFERALMDTRQFYLDTNQKDKAEQVLNLIMDLDGAKNAINAAKGMSLMTYTQDWLESPFGTSDYVNGIKALKNILPILETISYVDAKILDQLPEGHGRPVYLKKPEE